MQRYSPVVTLVLRLPSPLQVAIDFMMSLFPHWYSTIWGRLLFYGSMLAGLCFISIVAITLRKMGYLQDVITVEHYHDLGKLIFLLMSFGHTLPLVSTC